MAALKNLQKELEKRILQRERKSAIYASYRGDKNQAAIGAMLAQIPTIMRRQKYRNLNLALVVCLSILALLRLAVALFLIFAQVPLGFFRDFL
jgi:hypothetical protein